MGLYLEYLCQKCFFYPFSLHFSTRFGMIKPSNVLKGREVKHVTHSITNPAHLSKM